MNVEFVDGIEDVIVVGSTARVDFFVLRVDPRADRTSGERPTLLRSHALTVVMPLDALASAAAILEKTRTDLAESGRARSRDLGVGTPPPGAPLSPNFKVKPQG